MNERGRIVRQEKFLNRRDEYRRFFSEIGKAKIAMNASYCWQPPYELLESVGYEVKLAHPMKTGIIAEARIKTDAKDSEALAHLLRTNLPPILRYLDASIPLCVYIGEPQGKTRGLCRGNGAG
jgi:transposase